MEKTFEGRAYGRVNLIGEHTDYNGGWVLPTAIPQFTRVRLTPRAGREVTLRANTDPKRGDAREFTYVLGEEKKRGAWTDYLQGATKLLAAEGFELGGFTAEVSSTVPEGSGLSSSAALEVAFVQALREAFALRIDGVEVAKLGQRIENEFVGARVGIMDQMACSFARAGEALYLDTKTLEYERVRLPIDQMDLIVINSGLAHQNSGGDYNQRRSECENACAGLGIQSLRELGPDGLERIAKLPDIPQRRARHVFTENERVHESVRAIREGNLERLGELFRASHLSMRDDYAVSIPEIDRLIEICDAESAVYGARLTGGGFGGSIVAITKLGEGAAVAARVSEKYTRAVGATPTVLVPGTG